MPSTLPSNAILLEEVAAKEVEAVVEEVVAEEEEHQGQDYNQSQQQQMFEQWASYPKYSMEIEPKQMIS